MRSNIGRATLCQVVPLPPIAVWANSPEVQAILKEAGSTLTMVVKHGRAYGWGASGAYCRTCEAAARLAATGVDIDALVNYVTTNY